VPARPSITAVIPPPTLEPAPDPATLRAQRAADDPHRRAQFPDIRKAVAVLDRVHAAMMTLMELPPPALEVLRDEFEGMANERTDARGELKRAL
jgi:hypothetical protein